MLGNVKGICSELVRRQGRPRGKPRKPPGRGNQKNKKCKLYYKVPQNDAKHLLGSVRQVSAWREWSSIVDMKRKKETMTFSSLPLLHLIQEKRKYVKSIMMFEENWCEEYKRKCPKTPLFDHALQQCPILDFLKLPTEFIVLSLHSYTQANKNNWRFFCSHMLQTQGTFLTKWKLGIVVNVSLE